MKPRIAMLSHKLGYDDVRLRKEAESLAAVGYQVDVWSVSDRIGNIGKTEVGSITYTCISKKKSTNENDVLDAVRRSELYRRKHWIKFVVLTLKLLLKMANGTSVKTNVFRRKLVSAFSNQLFEVDVAGTVEKSAPQVVHAHDLFTLAAAHRIGHRQRIPVVYDAHELYRDYTPDQSRIARYWATYQERVYVNNQTRIITVSPGIAAILESDLRPKSVTLIHNSPPAQISRTGKSLRSDLELENDEQVMVYVGKLSLSQQLGNRRIIEAISSFPKLHMACVGPRNEDIDQEVNTLCQELNIMDRVHLLGPQPLSDLIEYISSADLGLYVHSGIDVGNGRLSMGNKFFEMAFAGLPVLFVKGLTDIESVCRKYSWGYFAEDIEVQTLSAGLATILSSPERFRMSEHNRARMIKEFSWEAQAKRITALYGELISR